jgi:hypothetical protein
MMKSAPVQIKNYLVPPGPKEIYHSAEDLFSWMKQSTETGLDMENSPRTRAKWDALR